MTVNLGTGTEVWSSVWWRDAAVSWLDDQLAAVGMKRTGDVEQPHVQPWATVLKAPTTRGPVWLKAAGPGTAFEVGLYPILHRVAPKQVLTPIAADVERGWLVLPDGGVPLGECVTGPDLVDALAAAVTQYGQLQRDLTPEVDNMLALGVVDMLAAVMPQRFDQALETVGEHVDRAGSSADRARHQQVAAMRDTFTVWCDQLAAVPGSSSLDHNDLHTWNMLLADPDRLDDVRFYDWGDSVLAHPFSSMLVALGFARHDLDVAVDGPEITRIRDAYLEVFSDLAPHAELVEALELACRVGKVARTLTWDRAVRALGSDQAGDFAGTPQHCLHSLPDDSYLGGA